MTTPKFAQIKQFIVDKIRSGLWQENQRVPSENELSTQFSVSRMTARRALSELTESGILTRSQGLGTFVASFKSQSSLLEIKNIADDFRYSQEMDEYALLFYKADADGMISGGQIDKMLEYVTTGLEELSKNIEWREEFLKDNAGIDEMKMLDNMKTIEEEYTELKEFLRT